MKRFLFLTLYFIILTFFFDGKIFAQSYHEEDKEGLRIFLRQNSTIANKANLDCFGLSAVDTLNWKNSEDWIFKMQGAISPLLLDWEWSYDFPSRLVRLEFKILTKYLDNTDEYPLLSGSLDCSRFSDLAYLDCTDSQLTSLDISHNNKLRKLYCSGNRLTNLDVSANPILETLCCTNNQITGLDLSNNTLLTDLHCSGNRISQLNISANPALKALTCSENNISNLDLSQNNYLTMLACNNNNLTLLDLSNNGKIGSLYCSSNKLDKLSLSQNRELTVLDCSGNTLKSLDISQNTKLRYLSCSDNSLSGGVDLSKNSGLFSVNCSRNNIESINVGHLGDLELLFLSGNKLSELNLSQNTNLALLDCSYNNLMVLDLSHNSYLSELNCSNNQLESVEINTTRNLFRSLACESNNFRFSSLPIDHLSYYKSLSYSPQNVIDAGEVYANSEIDLCGEYLIKEYITNFVWVESLLDAQPVNVVHVGSGRFVANNDYKDKILECRMTNEAYPDLILSYRVKILEDTITGIGVNENDSKPNLRIYPNPVEDVMYIRGEVDDLKALEIFTTTGTSVKKIQLSGSDGEIPVKELLPGIYLVKIVTQSGKSITEKIKKN